MNYLLAEIMGKSLNSKEVKQFKGLLLIGAISWIGFTIYKSRLELKKLQQEIKINEDNEDKPFKDFCGCGI